MRNNIGTSFALSDYPYLESIAEFHKVKTSNYDTVLPPLLLTFVWYQITTAALLQNWINTSIRSNISIKVYREASNKTPAYSPCHSPARMGKGSALISLAY